METKKIEPSNISALVVEDNMPMLKMIMNMLSNIGYNNVLSAMNGKEAQEIILDHENNVDIVLSDLIMPEMDGLELLRSIRASEDYWHLPFIMVTSVDDLEQIMSATEDHIDDYIMKPVAEGVLKIKVYSALKKVYDPDPYHRALYMGKRYLYEGRNEIALQTFEEARDLQPKQSAPYFYIAQLNEKIGNIDAAEKNYNLCKNISSDMYVKSLDGLGRIYLQKENYEKAKDVLSKSAEISPKGPERHLNLSLAKNKLGDDEEAEKSLKTALKLARKEKKLPKDFIEACLNCGLDDIAEEIMQKNLGADVEEIIVLNHMGIVCRQRKEFDRAKNYYERALKIAPSSAYVNYNYAKLFVETKEYEMAQAYLNRVVKHDPDFEDAQKILDKMQEKGLV